jgi:hypothetical protein
MLFFASSSLQALLCKLFFASSSLHALLCCMLHAAGCIKTAGEAILVHSKERILCNFASHAR